MRKKNNIKIPKEFIAHAEEMVSCMAESLKKQLTEQKELIKAELVKEYKVLGPEFIDKTAEKMVLMYRDNFNRRLGMFPIEIPDELVNIMALIETAGEMNLFPELAEVLKIRLRQRIMFQSKT